MNSLFFFIIFINKISGSSSSPPILDGDTRAIIAELSEDSDLEDFTIAKGMV